MTHDGVPVALLTPVQRTRLEQLVSAGEAKLPAEPFRVPDRTFAVTGLMTASEALERDRGE